MQKIYLKLLLSIIFFYSSAFCQQDDIVHLSIKDSKPIDEKYKLKSDIDLTEKVPELSNEEILLNQSEDTKEIDEDIVIDMNFDNISLSSIVKILAEKKNINLIVHKDLASTKVSLKTHESLSLSKAWSLLITLLDSHGYTHIQLGKVHKILPAKENSSEAVPIYSSAKGCTPEDLPDSQEKITYIYFLKNIRVDTAVGILSSLLTEKPQTVGDLDVFIIKDKSLNIKQAMKIIEELDLGGIRQTMSIKPLRFTDAETIAKI